MTQIDDPKFDERRKVFVGAISSFGQYLPRLGNGPVDLSWGVVADSLKSHAGSKNRKGEELNYFLGYVDNRNINGFCKLTDGTHYLALFSGVHYACSSLALALFSASELFSDLGNAKDEMRLGKASPYDHYGVFHLIFGGEARKSTLVPRCPYRTRYAVLLASFVQSFLWLHEAAHAVCGHAAFLKSYNRDENAYLMDLPDRSEGDPPRFGGSTHDLHAVFSPETFFEHEADKGACRALLHLIAMSPERYGMQVDGKTHRIAPEILMRLAAVGMILYFWLLDAVWIASKLTHSRLHPHPWFRGYLLWLEIEALASGHRHSGANSVDMDSAQLAHYERSTARIRGPLRATSARVANDFGELASSHWLTNLGVLFNERNQSEFRRYVDEAFKFRRTGIVAEVNEFAYAGH